MDIINRGPSGVQIETKDRRIVCDLRQYVDGKSKKELVMEKLLDFYIENEVFTSGQVYVIEHDSDVAGTVSEIADILFTVEDKDRG